ncbi:MAG: MBL fold metallo-hydrolase [Gammaproteobacteria bacterium]|nr:MBL fold metallo-hydrolase [Gammaproteobacteria bacterium]
MSYAGLTRLDDGIAAIDTEYARPLQDASHLIVESGRAAFVDTGVNDSVPLLLDALVAHDLDAADVDFVFLTHIHLDHAGGAGRLMQSLPNATCVIHPRGAPHMVDPAKIIAGTEAVYGVEQSRKMYGTIEPIDEKRIDIAVDGAWHDLNGRAMQTIFTEGHARHHYVLNDPTSQGVFTGDSFGVSYRELDTANGEFIFPTSTPIDFDPEAAHVSCDTILACEPRYAYLTHYSRVSNLEKLAGDMHECLDAYKRMAIDCANEKNRQQAIEDRMFEFLAGRLKAHGFAGDRDSMYAVLKIDVVLNSQGLGVWLDRNPGVR